MGVCISIESCPLYNSALSSGIHVYQEACRLEPFAQSLDSTFQESISRVLNVNGERSLDSLSELIDCLLKPTQEALKVLNKLEKDHIRKNYDLLHIVMDYLKNSSHSLDFCDDLTACLNSAIRGGFELECALSQFDKVEIDGGSTIEERRKIYWVILQQLKKFKTTTCKQISIDLSESLTTFYESLSSHSNNMQAKKRKLDKKLNLLSKYMVVSALEGCLILDSQNLQVEKRKVDKKFKTIKALKSLSNVMFVATFASVLVCSVLATAIAAPPLTTAMPSGNLGDWINLLRIKYENELKGHRKIPRTSHFWTCIGNSYLDNIRVLVDKWEFDIKSRLLNAEFAIEDEAAVMLNLDEMKKEVSVFAKSIDNLQSHTNNWRRDIAEGRQKV